jgi:hypothetical protein
VDYFNNRSIKIYSTNTQLIMYENFIIYKFIELKKIQFKYISDSQQDETDSETREKRREKKILTTS